MDLLSTFFSIIELLYKNVWSVQCLAVDFPLCQSGTHSLKVVTQIPVPVSYTHLDVYKRQLPTLMPTSNAVLATVLRQSPSTRSQTVRVLSGLMLDRGRHL